MLEDLIKTLDVKDKVDQGDVFKDVFFEVIGQNITSVILTPRCDLAYKADFVVMCAVLSFEKMFQAYLKKTFSMDFKGFNTLKQNVPIVSQKVEADKTKQDKSDENKWKQINEFLFKMIDNAYMLRYQWLDKLPGATGYWYVDFQMAQFLKASDLKPENRIARIVSPLRESLSSRYASYMGRVGLPPEKKEKDKLVQEIIESCSGYSD